MTLLIDLTNERSRVALIRGRRAIWRSAPGRDAVTTLLAAAKRARQISARGATGVLAAVSVPGGKRDASWSAIRAAVATANALAFAWGVPAATLPVNGDESESALEKAALAAAKRLKRGSRASATYDGEPNITRPKGVL